MSRSMLMTTLALFGVVLPFRMPSPVRAAELTLYIWDEYISENVLKTFEQETGVTVRQIAYDNDRTRDEIVASARGRQFDLVLFDSVSTRIFGANNQLAAITETEVPNIVNVDGPWRQSCGSFGAPYFYGTLGLVYDRTRYVTPPDSWLDLLRPPKGHWGRVAMLENQTDTLAPALLYLGYNINSENEGELKAAYELLLEQVPAVLNYSYAISNIQVADMAGRMDLALAYSGDQHILNEVTGSGSWAYVIPREGTALWVDCLSVTAWSPHRREALRFINYLNNPEVAARNAEEIRSATPISKAGGFMSNEAAVDPELFPPPARLMQGQRYRILSDENLRLRARILDSLLKRHEAQ